MDVGSGNSVTINNTRMLLRGTDPPNKAKQAAKPGNGDAANQGGKQRGQGANASKAKNGNRAQIPN